MELNLNRQPIAACELLLEASAEHSIECDVLLPDYCPDIVRILCCRTESVVTGCTAHKTTFTVEGMATVNICYIGEVGGVRRAEYKLPFSKSFELKGEARRPVWSVNAQQGKMLCRAVSKRRIDVGGAIMIKAKVFDCAGQQAVCSAEGMGVKLKSCNDEASDLTGQIERRISVAEMLSPVLGKPAPAEVVMASCRPLVQDTRITASRILIKGELMVHLLYKDSSDSAQLITADYTLPLSQVIEGEQLEDDMRCETELECVSLECAPEELGDEGQLRMEAQLAARIRFFRPITLSGATDSYSTLYPTRNTLSKIRVAKSCTQVMQRASVKTQADMPQGMTALLDSWAEVIEQATSVEEDALLMDMKVRFTAIISTEETEADSFEHVCDARIRLPAMAQSELMGNVSVLAASGAMEQDKLAFGCELLLNGMAVEFDMRSFITDLSVDEENPRTADELLGLMIYYAAQGEDVWDIAKRYGSLPEQIMADNGLQSQILEADTPLMIPTV